MKASVTTIDRGAAALYKRIDEASKAKGFTVGLHEEDGGASKGDGLTLVEVAEIHEFGLGNAPARSFVGAFADEIEDQAAADLRKLATAVVEGKVAAARGMDQLAARYGGLCQARISAGIPPELAEVTVQRKGSSVPLIDTGQLRASIRGQVAK